MKFSKISKLSAFARAESHLVQHTYHGAIGELLTMRLSLMMFLGNLCASNVSLENDPEKQLLLGSLDSLK